MSAFSMGGIASGLDTQNIIAELLRAQRQPVLQKQQQRAELQEVSSAWSDIRSAYSELRTAVDDLRRLTSFDEFTTVSSSDESVVQATKSGTPSTGSVSFTVDQLATAHHITGDQTFASADDAVGAGQLEITIDGQTHTFAADDTTTLQELANDVNNADIGVSAQVLKIDDGTYKLSLTADETGTDNAFTVTSTLDNLTSFTTNESAQDAKLTLGGDSPETITRSSNTIDDLIAGVTLDLRATSASEVTVRVERDADQAVEAVSGLVDAVNGVLDEIGALSDYDAENDVAGPLLGDPTARQLVMNLRSAISKEFAHVSGELDTASEIGINVTRDGRFSLDEAELRDALSDDWNGVRDLLARHGTAADARLAFISASDRTQPGTYAVEITQAAQVAAVTGDAYSAPAQDETITITSGSTDVDVTIQAGDDIATAVSRINTALSDAGVDSITASDDGGAIRLEEARYGSHVSFSVSGGGATFGLAGTHAGVDVAGTIDGVAASGRGQRLRATDGDAEGLNLRVTATQQEVNDAGGTLALGDVEVSDGIAGAISREVYLAEGSGGRIARARDGVASQIDRIDDRIEAMERRIEQRRETLVHKFAAMEKSLGRLQQQMQWLQAQLGSLG